MYLRSRKIRERYTPCIVCGSQSILTKEIAVDAMYEALKAYYRSPIPESILTTDYRMYKCSKCELEFCAPMLAGSGPFYEWIVAQGGYFPSERWEWEIAIERMLRRGPLNALRMLEVGCGSGIFLDRFKGITKLTGAMVVGVDTSPSAILECRRRGIEAYCESLAAHIERKTSEEARYDCVAAFHCLEHVEDPVELLREMKSILTDDGILIISVPYSPMTFEYSWFDPLNHPPHHLTRWNEIALTELGRAVGMDVTVTVAPAASICSRVLNAVTLSEWGPARRERIRRRVLLAALHPIRTQNALWRQIRRRRVQGKMAGDVMVATFTGIDTE